MKVLRNQLVLPLNYEVLIDENDLVWKLTEICDALDYSRLYDEYLRHWRSIDPAIMFEILVFAYLLKPRDRASLQNRHSLYVAVTGRVRSGPFHNSTFSERKARGSHGRFILSTYSKTS